MGFITRKERSRSQIVPKKKLAIANFLGITFLIVDVLLMVIDPISIITKYCSRVDYGTYIHEALAQECDSVHVSAYLFNVTNAERFQAGLDYKLKVDEVGPFTYQEIRKNEQLELDLNSKAIRYSPKVRTNFLPDESVARPEDVNITMPNVAMLSIASKLSTFSYLPRMGFNLLTNRLNSKALVNVKAKDYLWGYNEPLIKLGNTIMPGFVNFDVLGVLDRLYDKKAKYVFELSSTDEDKFSIRAVNGSHGLNKWGYKDPSKRTTCNTFTNAYEGLGYPPDMTSTQPIRIYRPIFCRFLELDYHSTTMTPYGVEALEYKISNRTYRNNPETQCLCNEGICIEGVSDMSPCFLGLPVVISNAHFMHADPKLYERIEGIRPDEEKHGSSFVIEPKLGMALDTRFAIQVSLLVRDVRFNTETSRFSDMLIPIVYFKIVQPPLVPKQVYSLNLIYITAPRILLGVQILLAILGLISLAYAVKSWYWNCLFSDGKHIVLHNIDNSMKNNADMPLVW